MNRRLIYVCLCITLLSFFSCSKEYDDEITNLQSEVDKDAMYSMSAGKYAGIWLINDIKVEDVSSGVCLEPSGVKNCDMLSFGQSGFPSESVVKQLFPDTDISELSIELVSGGYIVLQRMGYSDNMIYYSSGEDYVQHQLQITDKSDHRFVLVLVYAPSETTVSLGLTSHTLSIGLVIKQIEIIDEIGNETVRELNPEMKLTFIGSRKND